MNTTNQWQRVDNTGCVTWVLQVFLLSWAVVLPYAMITGSTGWFLWSMICVLAGATVVFRQRRATRAHTIPGVTVEVYPAEVGPGEGVAVRLHLADPIAKEIRWWKASLIAQIGDGHDGRSYELEPVTEAEFAIDPEAGDEPVAELEMILDTPGRHEIDRRDASAWWVQVTIETAHGRMESGRVGVGVSSHPVG